MFEKDIPSFKLLPEWVFHFHFSDKQANKTEEGTAPEENIFASSWRDQTNEKRARILRPSACAVVFQPCRHR